MEIFTKIKGISYRANCCPKELKEINGKDFDINSAPASCILQGNNFTYAISQWVSPKRTRSYPFARIYDTLISSHKRITVIPVIKDEGAKGDRDFIQWDTISLMSLLDIYVILAYYDTVEKHSTRDNKITK